MIENTITSQVQQMQASYGPAPEKMEAADRLFEESYKASMWSRIRPWFWKNKSTLLCLHPASLVLKTGPTRLQRVRLARI